MLIKKLIQRLLDSRTTPEEAGHSAMPSASETVLLTQNDAFQSWGNIHQGVAADDGYVNIFARSVNNTTSEMRVLTSGMTFSSAQTGLKRIWLVPLLSQRARLSLSMPRLKEPPLVSSSFRPLVLNPAVGGASC